MARSPLVGVAAIGLLLGGIALIGLTLIADGGPHKAASHGRALAGGSAAGSAAGSCRVHVGHLYVNLILNYSLFLFLN